MKPQDQTSNPAIALVILAKLPVAGQVKTRLIPALGAEGAAKLASDLLNHCLETAKHTKHFSHIELCLAADEQSPSDKARIAHCRRAIDQTNTKNTAENNTTANNVTITPQGAGDLGARMQRAFERLLDEHDAVIMIGTDAPDMTADLLDQAARNLTQSGTSKPDAVFVPALDGGYTLIGLHKTQTNHLPALFGNMPWSTCDVMALTRKRLDSVDANWHEYPPMADIDEPADLARLPASWLTAPSTKDPSWSD